MNFTCRSLALFLLASMIGFSGAQTDMPTLAPTTSAAPTASAAPTSTASAAPTSTASAVPTSTASAVPSATPSVTSSTSPSALPSAAPSSAPSNSPSIAASVSPSDSPTSLPSSSPSVSPTLSPTSPPTLDDSSSKEAWTLLRVTFKGTCETSTELQDATVEAITSIVANKVDSVIQVSVKIQGAIDKCQSLPAGSRRLNVDLDAQRDQVELLARVIQKHSEDDIGSVLTSKQVHQEVVLNSGKVTSTAIQALGKAVRVNKVALLNGSDTPDADKTKTTSAAAVNFVPSYFFGALTMMAVAVLN